MSEVDGTKVYEARDLAKKIIRDYLPAAEVIPLETSLGIPLYENGEYVSSFGFWVKVGDKTLGVVRYARANKGVATEEDIRRQVIAIKAQALVHATEQLMKSVEKVSEFLKAITGEKE